MLKYWLYLHFSQISMIPLIISDSEGPVSFIQKSIAVGIQLGHLKFPCILYIA